MNYKEKYLKYKLKYLNTKRLYGGMEDGEEDMKGEKSDVLKQEQISCADAGDPDGLALTLAGMTLGTLMGSPVEMMDIVTPVKDLKRREISSTPLENRNPEGKREDNKKVYNPKEDNLGPREIRRDPEYNPLFSPATPIGKKN